MGDIICRLPINSKIIYVLCQKATETQKNILIAASNAERPCEILDAAHIIVGDSMLLDVSDIAGWYKPSKNEIETFFTYWDHIFDHGLCRELEHDLNHSLEILRLDFKIW